MYIEAVTGQMDRHSVSRKSHGNCLSSPTNIGLLVGGIELMMPLLWWMDEGVFVASER